MVTSRFGKHLRRITKVGVLAGLAAFAACSQSQYDDPSPEQPGPAIGPGSKAWGDQNVSCVSSDQCGANEVCTGHVCQMKRCTESTYTSTAPIGQGRYFSRDLELVVVDSNARIAGYKPGAGSFAHVSGTDWSSTQGQIVDVAGGNFFGSRPEATAIILSGSNTVVVINSKGVKTKLPLGFTPIAVAGGDVDQDGVDEVVAMAADGRGAICHVGNAQCDGFNIEVKGATFAVRDVTVADVGGDGFEKPIILLDVGGQSQITVYNVNAAKTGGPLAVSSDIDRRLGRISAGDIDGTGVATVVGLEFGGFLINDKLHSFAFAKDGTLTRTSTTDVKRDTLDIAVGTLGSAAKGQVALLRGDNSVEVFGGASTPGSLLSLYRAPLGGTAKVTRIGLSDLNGDSPAIRYVRGPELVPGRVIPVAVLTYPPYSRTYSDGVSNFLIGNVDVNAKAQHDTLSINAGADFGVDVKLGPVIGSYINEHVEKTWVKTHGQNKVLAIGQIFAHDANPNVEGYNAATVLVSCACYHAYNYVVEDPAGKLGLAGADGASTLMMVPVGGQTSLWSSRRYNAMARAVGSLPLVTVPYTLGDPSSYPKRPLTLAGGEIPPEDMVFTKPPAIRVSDAARAFFSLVVGKSETNSSALVTSLQFGSGFNAMGGHWNFNGGRVVEHGEDITVGHDAVFGGGVPPILNNAGTPEDEFKLKAYTFTPYLYREHYKDADGKDAGYYVMLYAVSK
ncbi:MAG: hypothetical protein NVSMB1_02710 [Polyangiales bacterium]